MPGENWAEQIQKYLGDNPAQYFSCPVNPSPQGFTTYVMVQYDDTAIGSLMLIELPEPVPLVEAVITVDEVLALPGSRTVETIERECCGRTFTVERVTVIESRLTAHIGILARDTGANTVHRNGAVRFMLQTIAKEELLRLLGREKFYPQMDAD